MDDDYEDKFDFDELVTNVQEAHQTRDMDLRLVRLDTAVNKAFDKGWFKLRLVFYYSPSDENNLESVSAGIEGSRIETDKEFKDRMKWLKAKEKTQKEVDEQTFKMLKVKLGK